MTSEAIMVQGLSTDAAAKLEAAGKINAAPKKVGRTVGQILLVHTFTWFNILNLMLGAVLAAVGSYRDMLFLGVVVSNTLIGVVQEVRARRTIERLTLLAVAPVRVVRDGRWIELPPDRLVEGDLVSFAAGEQIVADATVLSGEAIANDSLLTGESDGVPKSVSSELLSGSFITEGKVIARLEKVGSESYAGRLAENIGTFKMARSRLMDDMKWLIRIVSFFLLPLTALLFAKSYWLMQRPLAPVSQRTVAAAIGMIPEGLMLLTSVALTVGVIRLGRRKALVQELYGIENLARVDTLCIDKTGTITKGRLRVETIEVLPDSDETEFVGVMRRFVQASEEENGTARALADYFEADAEPAVTVSGRVPFSSARKWSAVSLAAAGTTVVGAPEFILKDAMPEAVRESVEAAAERGLRVLLAAHSPNAPDGQTLPVPLRPLGLIYLNDEIREDFAETVAFLGREDVAIKVISGDNPRTVAEVARRAGLSGAENWVDASTLTTPEALRQAASAYTVFGRVAPDQKEQLVLALKDERHTVAMMGDGVNDVLALKSCDCAIAMAGGSDAARRVSQITLLDENFSAIPAIVMEGRRVINNITRSASLFLVKTCFSFLMAFIVLILPWPYPFRPIQMTLIGTFTVGIPSFFLAFEPNKDRVRRGFLRSIFGNALPGALTNIVMLILLTIVGQAVGLSNDERGTIAVAAVAVTGLLILVRTMWPLGMMRLALLFGMSSAIIVALLFFPTVFYIVPLGLTGWLVLTGIACLSPLLLWALHRLVAPLAGKAA